MHVGRFLIQAFGFMGGNLFMAALLLAGFTLGTGLSWLVLVEGLGGAVLKATDWVGGLILAPLSRSRPANSNAAPPPDSRWWSRSPMPRRRQWRRSDRLQGRGCAAPPPLVGLVARPTDQREQGTGRRSDVHDESRWRKSHLGQLPFRHPTPLRRLAKPRRWQARGRRRIEPVLNLPTRDRRPHAVTVAPEPVAGASARPMLDMLTLVPTAGIGRNPPLTSPSGNSPTGDAGRVSADGPAHGRGFRRRRCQRGRFRPVAIDSPAWFRSLIRWLTRKPILRRKNKRFWKSRRIRRRRSWFRIRRRAPVSPAPVATLARRVATRLQPRPVCSPSLDLLDRPPARTAGYSSETLVEMSRRVEVLLKSFGIEAQVVAVEPGPVITRFEVEPAPGVKVSQISNLAKDLARGLSVIGVRVVRSFPASR